MAYPRHPLPLCLTEKTPTSRKSTPRLDAETPLIVPFEGSSLFIAHPSRGPRPTEETATPSPCFRFVLLEVAKRNGEPRERDEEREAAREREERERVVVGKGGCCGRKKRERDGSFEGLPRRGSQDLKKIGGE